MRRIYLLIALAVLAAVAAITLSLFVLAQRAPSGNRGAGWTWNPPGT